MRGSTGLVQLISKPRVLPFRASLPVALAGRTIDKSRAREIQMRYAPIAVTVLTGADWVDYAILHRCDYLRCTPYPPTGILRTVFARHPCLPRTTNPNQAAKHPASATGTADLESLTRISPSLYAPHEIPSINPCGEGSWRNSIYSGTNHKPRIAYAYVVCLRGSCRYPASSLVQETVPPPWNVASLDPDPAG